MNVFRLLPVVGLILMSSPTLAQDQNPAAPNQPQIAHLFVSSDAEIKQDQEIKPGFGVSVYISATESAEEVTNHIVDPSGAIVMKLIGRVSVKEKKPVAAEADIEERLKKYIKEPDVTVSIISVPP